MNDYLADEVQLILYDLYKLSNSLVDLETKITNTRLQDEIRAGKISISHLIRELKLNLT